MIDSFQILFVKEALIPLKNISPFVEYQKLF